VVGGFAQAATSTTVTLPATGSAVDSYYNGAQLLVTGDPVNVAARLEQAAGAGEILIGDATHALG
jgi:class 3 adenylate cyclase